MGYCMIIDVDIKLCQTGSGITMKEGRGTNPVLIFGSAVRILVYID